MGFCVCFVLLLCVWVFVCACIFAISSALNGWNGMLFVSILYLCSVIFCERDVWKDEITLKYIILKYHITQLFYSYIHSFSLTLTLFLCTILVNDSWGFVSNYTINLSIVKLKSVCCSKSCLSSTKQNIRFSTPHKKSLSMIHNVLNSCVVFSNGTTEMDLFINHVQ